MSLKVTPVHAAAALAFVAMAGISWMRTPFNEGSKDSVATASVKAYTRDDARAKRYGPPEAVRQRLEKIRQMKDFGERMREIIDLANSLPVGELGRWLDRGWFTAGDGYEKKVFTLLAKERWKQEYPEGYAAWGLRTKKEGRDVLVEWARTDPERMLEFFRKHPDPVLELQLWATASNLDPGFAMKRLLELAKTGRLDPNFISLPVDKLASVIAKADPSLLETHLDDLPVEWRKQIQGALVAVRLQADFPGEVAKLAEMPDGWSLLMRTWQNVDDFALRVLDSVATFPASWKASLAEEPGGLVNDPRWLDADLKALGFTPDQARKILTETMRMAVFSSPERVLGGLHEADLTDDQRKEVLASLFNPGSDPERMAGTLAYLKSPELRELAEAMMVPGGESASVAEVSPVPEKAQGNRMEQLAEAGSSDGALFIYEASCWSEETAASMLKDFKGLPEEKKRVVAGIITRGANFSRESETSRAVGGEAIRFLIDDLGNVEESYRAQSEERQSHLAALHAARWVEEDPPAASQWVLSLPAGKPRDQAIELLTTTWKRYDPDAAGRWVEGLTAGDREALKASQ